MGLLGSSENEGAVLETPRQGIPAKQISNKDPEEMGTLL